MTLIVHEITTSVNQSFIADKNKIVAVVRPHLYVKNTPTGTLKVQIYDETGSALLSESDPLDIEDITDAIEFHGHVSFDVNVFMKKDSKYIVSVVAGGGYSFSESGYVGVCNDYDSRIYEPEVAASNVYYAPLDIQFWELSQK